MLGVLEGIAVVLGAAALLALFSWWRRRPPRVVVSIEATIGSDNRIHHHVLLENRGLLPAFAVEIDGAIVRRYGQPNADLLERRNLPVRQLDPGPPVRVSIIIPEACDPQVSVAWSWRDPRGVRHRDHGEIPYA